ncbi:hypothetical protein [Amycolatopsis sp. RTGN1]|uniref:hypothetical protein n=1 Tax=Amycolatopsis ponsaeliensis TaxID=2992142 RepID=UPI00254B2BB8|nr:hypothetical protein [Amycolatopsis sp. RTGN1]
MSVERKPDRRFAWSLRIGKAVVVDDVLVSAGQSATLKALPGCSGAQRQTTDGRPARVRHGAFIRLAGAREVLRMTPSGRSTDDEENAAVFPDEQSAQRRVEQFLPQLEQQYPGSDIWTAPL